MQNVKPCKFTTERELDQESQEIIETLKDIKGDWSKRLKALLLVQSIIVSEDMRRCGNFSNFMSKLVSPLTFQLTDLRSQITKEASKAICLMAQVLQQEFEPLAPKFISKNSLYKLLNSSKSIMSEHSHICIVEILKNTVSPRVIPHIYEEVKSKNPTVRIRNAEYLHLILTLYPEECLANYLPQIEDLLSSLLQDAKSEARQFARFAFFRFKEIYEDRAMNIFDRIDIQNQKAIVDDEDQGLNLQQTSQAANYQGSPQKTVRQVHQQIKEYEDLQEPAMLNETVKKSLDVLKLSRSTSRGTKLSSSIKSEKAIMQSPSKSQLIHQKSPLRGGRNEATRQSIKQVEEVKYSQTMNLPDSAYTDKSKDVTSPKPDTSKLRLLKSPKTVLQSNFNFKSSESQTQQSQSEQSVKEDQLQKTEQLKHLREKLKTSDGADTKLNSSLKSKDSEQISSLSSSFKKGSLQQLKKEKSASPMRSPRIDKNKKPMKLQNLNANSLKLVQQSHSQQNSVSESKKPQPVKQQSSKPKANQHQVQDQSKKKKVDSDYNRQEPEQILDSSSDQKIFDELDFLNQTESIENLVISAQSKNSTERLRSFKLIKQSEDQLNECSDQLVKKLFKLHIDYLKDENPMVIIAVQDSLISLVQYAQHLLDKHLDEIVPSVIAQSFNFVQIIFNMVSDLEEMSISSSDLINVICQQSQPSDLVLIIMDVLREQSANLKVVIASLEVLVVLLKDDCDYCQKNANVLETTLKILEIIQKNKDNMDIIMPSIAVMLAMRDRNFSGFIKAILYLKEAQLNFILDLVSKFAPDLESDIRKHAMQNKVYKGNVDGGSSFKSERVAANNMLNLQITQREFLMSCDINQGELQKQLKEPKSAQLRGKGQLGQEILSDNQSSGRKGSNQCLSQKDLKEDMNDDDLTPVNQNSGIKFNFNQEETFDLVKQSTPYRELAKYDDMTSKDQALQNEENFSQMQSRLKEFEDEKESSSVLLKSQQSIPSNKKDSPCHLAENYEQNDSKFVVPVLMQTSSTDQHSNSIKAGGQQQHNYIMSKSGDTVDEVEETVTPITSSKHLQFNFQQAVSDRDAEIDLKDPNTNRLLSKIFDKLTSKTGEIKDFIQKYGGPVLECIFSILETDHPSEIKDKTIQCLVLLNKESPTVIDMHLLQLIDVLSQVYTQNKKVIPKIDDLVQSLITFQDKMKVFESLEALLGDQDHQNLQALIKISNTAFKCLHPNEIEVYFAIVFDKILILMNHTSANVRKCLVFLLVDMGFLMKNEDFQKFLIKFNANQQKLVNIYIERRQQQATE